MLKIEDLTRAAEDHKDTRRRLTHVAWEIAKLRRGDDVAHAFDLFSFAIGPIERSGHDIDPDNEMYVDYAAGTIVVHVNLHHERWCDDIDVVFPASYLDGTNGYIALEAAAIAERKADRKHAETEAAAADEVAAKESRRLAYERLRAEFEGDPVEAATRKRMVDLARETLAGHPDKDAPNDLVLIWLANRAELHAEAALIFAGETR